MWKLTPLKLMEGFNRHRHRRRHRRRRRRRRRFISFVKVESQHVTLIPLISLGCIRFVAHVQNAKEGGKLFFIFGKLKNKILAMTSSFLKL